MTIQLSTGVRDAKANAIETTIGATAKLYLYSGAQPANCAAADPAGLLATLTLPSDWWNAASGNGQKTLLGSWTGTASGAGTVASFRIKDNAGTTCHMQGTVTITGSGGDLTLDNPVLANGQTITINSFTWTEGNA